MTLTFLKHVGFVTNAHVVQDKYDLDDIYRIQLHRSRYDSTIKLATIKKRDKARDIAILEVEGFDKDFGFESCIENEVGQAVASLGYPKLRDSLNTDHGHIRQYRDHYMSDVYNHETGMLGCKQERFLISSRIVVGNSGGPVVNSENQVIGVATKRHSHLTENEKDEDTEVSAVIKVQDVLAFGTEALTEKEPLNSLSELEC